jgi:hypothetical protein
LDKSRLRHHLDVSRRNPGDYAFSLALLAEF